MYKRWIGLIFALTVLFCGCSGKEEDGGFYRESETETVSEGNDLKDIAEDSAESGIGDAAQEKGTADMTEDGPETGTEDAGEEGISGSRVEEDPTGNRTESAAGNVSGGMDQEESDIFARLPSQFYFGSGVGAWGVELTIAPDGTFVGHYEDTDLSGSTEEGYTAEVYLSDFSGRFAEPVQLDEHIYATSVENLVREWDGEDEIIDEILYHYVEPHGLSEQAEILIYTPGTPIEDVAEEFMAWSSIYSEERKALPEGYYGIYNVTDGYGFFATETDCFWDHEYTGSTEKVEVMLRPSYYTSYLSIGEGTQGMHFFFMWDEDGQTDFWVHEDTITAGYQMHLDFNEDRSKVTLTLTSDLGISLVKYGGTKEGVLTVELERSK